MSSDLLPIAQLVNWDSFRRRPIVSNEAKSFIHCALLCTNACNFNYWLLYFNTHLPYCLKPFIITTPLINKIHNHVFVIISKPGQNIFITCTLNYLTNGNCSRLYFTVKPDKSITCVILFPVLCDVDFHAVLTIFYTCVLHCLIRHVPVYSPRACWIRQVSLYFHYFFQYPLSTFGTSSSLSERTD